MSLLCRSRSYAGRSFDLTNGLCRLDNTAVAGPAAGIDPRVPKRRNCSAGDAALPRDEVNPLLRGSLRGSAAAFSVAEPATHAAANAAWYFGFGCRKACETVGLIMCCTLLGAGKLSG
jgi:hypothetical protein